MTDIEEKRAAFKEARQQKKRQQVLGAVAIVVAGLGAIVGVSAWMERQAPDAGPPNHADRLTTVLPVTELNNLDGAWIGVMSPTWAGLTDPKRAASDCDAALVHIADDLSADGSLTLLSPDGEPVVECMSD